jgi:hypothetical protein
MQGQERERKEPSEFNVIVKAKDLVKHTFTITNSTERYPKKYRFTLVNRIQEKAVDIYEMTLEANELDLRQADEHRQRQRLQAKALTYCKELLFFIELSQEMGFHSYLTESGAVIRKVRRKSKNNARRRLTKMRGLLETGKITPEKVEQSYKSWRGHAPKGNCYHLIRNMDQHYNKLFGQYAAAGNRGGVAVSEEKEEGKECRKS